MSGSNDVTTSAGTRSTPELFQFRASHFNEKARWALDYKGIPHRRRTLVPGPHKMRVLRLSGQEQVPVLQLDGKVVAGSAEIIAHLEERHPEPALYPVDATARREALETQRWFDADVGPAIRVALFHEMFQDTAYFARMFTWDQSMLVRLGYRAAFPAVKVLMTRAMRITADSAARGREVTAKALDFVAREAGASGHLVGDDFTVVDLTAAALLAPAVELAESPFGYPEPRSPILAQWWARWADHPGAQWVRDTYASHRPRSCEIPS